MFKSLLFLLLSLNIAWCSDSMQEWDSFKKDFIQEDGRVIDRSNHDITHTEGIGYAMFFAVAHNDYDTFLKINTWLESNLPKNRYGLYPWKWGKKDDGTWSVLDLNNATDGDLWIAYARLKGSQVFNKPDLKQEILPHIHAIENYLIVSKDNKFFLLPGQSGFIHEDRLRLNPSYYIPFIFDSFAFVTGHDQWNQLIQNALEILSHRFTHFQLHPDWIDYSISEHRYQLNPTYPLHSYDAIRIPLFWGIWYAQHPDEKLKSYLAGYQTLGKLPFLPIWVNLVDNSMSIFPDSSQSMASSIHFLSIILDYSMRPYPKGFDETHVTYFGSSLTLFSLLPLHTYCR